MCTYDIDFVRETKKNKYKIYIRNNMFVTMSISITEQMEHSI